MNCLYQSMNYITMIHGLNYIKNWRKKMSRYKAMPKEFSDAVEVIKKYYKFEDYVKTIDPKLLKKTKTQEKYRLPSGDIIKKFSKPKYKRTDDLIKWVKDSGLNYLKITEDVEWGELKKETKLVGDK